MASSKDGSSSPRAKRKEPISVEPAGKYFSLESDPRRQALGFEVVNLSALQANGKGFQADPSWVEGRDRLDPDGGPWRVPNFLEPPRIVYDAKFKLPTRDSEGGNNAWIVSESLKTIVERLAPGGCVFRPCDTIYSDGEVGPKRWVGSITRVFADVIDLAGSENVYPVKYPNGHRGFSVSPASRIEFRRDRLPGAHLFRVFELGRKTFCDEVFVRECQKAKITGLRFHSWDGN